MSNNLYSFVMSIISNEDIKDMYNEYLQILEGEDKQYAIYIYQLIHSDNFLELVKTLEMSNSSFDTFKEGILEIVKINNNSITKPFLLYTSIVALVNKQLTHEHRNSNTSVAYLTAKNVQKSEDIESLGVKSFSSITNIFKNFRFFKKKSASLSIVFTGDLMPAKSLVNSVKARNTLTYNTFYFKVFPIGQVKKNTGKMGMYESYGLEFELKAYNELFKLVKYNITPNILCKIVSGTFNNFDSQFISNEALSTEFKQLVYNGVVKINHMQGVENTDSIWNTTGVLMTNPGEEQLADVFTDLTPLERKKIMFQILYTLYVFEKLEISHGDLHYGNIFINDVEERELCYIVDGVPFSFKTTKLVKIYDFDFGNISRDTSIRLNTKSKFKINRVLNPDRWKGTFLDTQYGQSEFFNKNLDLCILLFKSFGYNAIDLENLVFFGSLDKEFDRFIGLAFPGFHEYSDKIQESYNKAFTLEANRKEASVLFNKKISGPSDIPKLEIGSEILQFKWYEYYRDCILPNHGRLMKSFTQVIVDGKVKPTFNNQLWIPSDVIIPKSNMFKLQYFSEFQVPDMPINVRKSPVYTIDGKIQ